MNLSDYATAGYFAKQQNPYEKFEKLLAQHFGTLLDADIRETNICEGIPHALVEFDRGLYARLRFMQVIGVWYVRIELNGTRRLMSLSSSIWENRARFYQTIAQE